MQTECECDIDFDEEEADEERNALEEASSILRHLIPGGWGSHAWVLDTANPDSSGNPIIDKIYDTATITCIISKEVESFQYDMGIASKPGTLRKKIYEDMGGYDFGNVLAVLNKSHVFQTAR